MSILKRSSIALIASVALASPAMAQTFQFNVTSCFYTGSSACTTYGDPKTYTWNSNNSSITFDGAAVSGTPNGSGSFANFLLGTFSFYNSSGTDNLPSDLKMRMRVDFIAPTGISQDPYTFAYADIDGQVKSVSGPDQGDVSWTFSGANDVYFTGGSTGTFKFTVHDGNMSNFATSGSVYGSIQCVTEDNAGYSHQSYGGGDDDDGPSTPTYHNSSCAPGGSAGAQGSVVPEPSTYMLMATGLAGLGFVARRRRRA